MDNNEAIVWLKETKKHYGEYHEKADEALDIAIKALEERPQGEWVEDNSGDRYCSECGNSALYSRIGYKIESQFCPYCGVKMKQD